MKSIICENYKIFIGENILRNVQLGSYKKICLLTDKIYNQGLSALDVMNYFQNYTKVDENFKYKFIFVKPKITSCNTSTIKDFICLF